MVVAASQGEFGGKMGARPGAYRPNDHGDGANRCKTFMAIVRKLCNRSRRIAVKFVNNLHLARVYLRVLANDEVLAVVL